MSSLALNIIALAALLPAALVALRAGAGRDGVFWGCAALAVAGPALWAWVLMSAAWQTSLSAALWVSIAASATLFIVLSWSNTQAWRLAPLLMPFLATAGLLASMVQWVEAPPPLSGQVPAAWLDLHIVVSVLTYALLTLAAVASLATFLQERALKRKAPTGLTRMLPSVADAETLAGRLLLASEAVLGLGLVTGMATQYFESGAMLTLSHKTLLSLLAFVVIGLLLIGHRVCGVRGRVAARVVLLAYMLLTLAYPGVKFVTQVLLS
ncbi:MAG: cytochrome c biogenesis protein CcsA [Magnetospirillum sp.]|nr:cytochrome c biogenesis protein CcsA [Magnetospirillum sp.]